MILYHATPRKHLASIKAEGLDPMKSTGKRKEVWLHTKSKRAVGSSAHPATAQNHDIVLIKVEVPRKAHTPLEWALVLCSVYHQFEAVIDADLISQSPIKEG